MRQPRRASRAISLIASAVLHLLLVLLIASLPKPPSEDRIIELSFGPVPDDQPTPPPALGNQLEPTPPTVQAPIARPKRPKAAVVAQPTVPEAPEGELPAAPEEVAPPEPPSPPSPPSFQAWQGKRFSAAAMRGALKGSGAADGTASATGRGRDQCVPAPGREVEVLYVLFDSSGSMTSTGKSQALSCAHQYAKTAIAGGASVVVGNFALGTTFTGPTRDMLDVEIAMRAVADGRATVLPSRELQPYLDAAPKGATSELVIVSDGAFATPPDVLTWYRYFLDINPNNRGLMYTVGMPGQGASVMSLRNIGFDVYRYQQLPGAGF